MDELVEIASSVGSDISFFLYESSAVVSGLGEKVKPVAIKGFFEHILIVFPEFSVNTKAAYDYYDKKNLTKQDKININSDHVTEISSLKDWVLFVENDFEDPVFELCPELHMIKSEFGADADKVFMTGSGSAMVALYSDKNECDEAFLKMSGKYGFVKKVILI